MSKVTKKQLHNGWHCHDTEIIKMKKELRELKQSVLRLEKLTDEKLLDEPQLKQLDQSVFNGLDEKWRFAAVDLDGESWVYREQPKIDKGDDRWSASNTPPNSIGTGYDTTDWQNSLIERDVAKEPVEVDLSSELTGSELCKAMLARGDRWILCGNTTDGFASPCIIDGYRCSEDDLGFVLTNGKSIEPRYIYPVNNQGEPLTQAEAGL